MPDGTYSENVYSNGWLWKTIDRAGRVTEYLRDTRAASPTKPTMPGRSVIYRYDASGRLTNLVDQAGNNTF